MPDSSFLLLCGDLHFSVSQCSGESETFRFMYFSFRFLVSRIIRGKVPLDSCFDLYKTTEIEVFIHCFRFKHWFKQMREKPPKSAENDTKKAVIR